MLLLIIQINLPGQDTCRLLVNEILFDPPKGGADYVELLNRGPAKNLQNYLIAHRDDAGRIASIKKISKNDYLLFTDSFAVLTSDTDWIHRQHYIPANTKICHLTALPSYPDDEGVVVILHARDSTVCDELAYHKSWHFSLVNDPAGVALERISIDELTNDRNNWTSASFSSGYGTPGRMNSQYRASEVNNQIISVSPKLFSPDNDGLDDYLQLRINMNSPGGVANAIIYDISGRRVKYLVKNSVLGTSNVFRWDGQDDRDQRLPPGPYVMMTDIFNLQGQTKKFKNVIVIGKRAH